MDIKKNTQSLQFGRWFKESKVVKEKASRYKALSRRKKGVIPTGIVHKITSLYKNVKQQTETLQFGRWFKESNVVKEKASRYKALSYREGVIPTGIVHKITSLYKNVKQQTETLQFGRWFKESKVVKENGEPIEVYHGTDWQGNVFDDTNGIWFSEKEDYAKEIGGKRTIKKAQHLYDLKVVFHTYIRTTEDLSAQQKTRLMTPYSLLNRIIK